MSGSSDDVIQLVYQMAEQIDAQNAKIVAQQTEIAVLKAQIDAQNAKIVTQIPAATEIENFARQVLATNAELEATIAALKALAAQNDALAAENMKLSDKLATFQTACGGISSDASEARGKAQELQTKLNKLNCIVARQLEREDKLQTEVDELKKAVNGYDDAFTQAVAAQKAMFDADIAELVAKHKTALQQMESNYVTAIHHETTKSHDKDEQIVQQRAKIEELDAENASLKTEIATLKAERAVLYSQIAVSVESTEKAVVTHKE